MMPIPFPIILFPILLVASIYSVNPTDNEKESQQSSQSQSPIHQQHFVQHQQPPTHSSDTLPNAPPEWDFDNFLDNIGDHQQLLDDLPPPIVNHYDHQTSIGATANAAVVVAAPAVLDARLIQPRGRGEQNRIVKLTTDPINVPFETLGHNLLLEDFPAGIHEHLINHPYGATPSSAAVGPSGNSKMSEQHPATMPVENKDVTETDNTATAAGAVLPKRKKGSPFGSKNKEAHEQVPQEVAIVTNIMEKDTDQTDDDMQKYFLYYRTEPVGQQKGEYKAKCLFCNNNYTRTNGSTSGLAKHLKKHTEQWEKYDKAKKEIEFKKQQGKALDGSAYAYPKLNGKVHTYSLQKYFDYKHTDKTAKCLICPEEVGRETRNNERLIEHLKGHEKHFKMYDSAKRKNELKRQQHPRRDNDEVGLEDYKENEDQEESNASQSQPMEMANAEEVNLRKKPRKI